MSQEQEERGSDLGWGRATPDEDQKHEGLCLNITGSPCFSAEGSRGLM